MEQYKSPFGDWGFTVKDGTLEYTPLGRQTFSGKFARLKNTVEFKSINTLKHNRERKH